MFRPLALYIGLRYTRAKRHNHFISFISATSMIGIALGVAVLITVLSVMNGFDEQIQDRFFAMAPQITITDFRGLIADWHQLSDTVSKNPDVLATAPYAGGQALISYDGSNQPLVINGILPEQQSRITQIHELMSYGKLADLTAGSFGIVLGEGLASRLGAKLGDKLTVFIPQTSVSIAGIETRSKRFTLVGVFKAGSGFGFDNQLGFIHLQDAQTLFRLDNNVSGLRLKIKNIFLSSQLSGVISHQLPSYYSVSDWTEQFGAFFKAVKMEKTMMFLILMLIIAVAAFNLVSSLVMVVNDKQSDIAILRTLGMKPNTILRIFMVQGTLVGIIGTLVGLLGGLLLAHNATAIVDWIQRVFNVQLLSSSIYFVDYLPSKIEWSDLIEVCGLALLMSFIATLYPAWRAAKTQPAQALRYD